MNIAESAADSEESVQNLQSKSRPLQIKIDDLELSKKFASNEKIGLSNQNKYKKFVTVQFGTETNSTSGGPAADLNNIKQSFGKNFK